MYKININVSELFLIDPSEKEKFDEDDDKVMVLYYHGRPSSIMNYVDMMEKSKEKKIIVIISEQYEKLKDNVKLLYPVIVASGGLVVNEENEILFIFRRGFWDLPKGKIEDGETKKVAALREVEEETGAKNLKLIKKIGTTRHLFRRRSGKRAIKKSHWYLMETKKQNLIPQANEDIDKAVWMTRKEFKKANLEMYPSLSPILNYKF